MPNHKFHPEVSEAIQKFLNRSKKVSSRKIAVFDADGTLWRGDSGESFLQKQIENKTLTNIPTGDLWAKYWEAIDSGKAKEAYTWPAIWNAGRKAESLFEEAKDFFSSSYKENIFIPMKDLVSRLIDSGFEVWIVSASIRWVVAAGVEAFGIPFDRVIGMAVKTGANGCLTPEIEGVLPYRDGKTKECKRLIGNIKPLFAAGNTAWDKNMLELSQDLVLTVHSEKKGERNFSAEQELKGLAQKSGWLVQEF